MDWYPKRRLGDLADEMAARRPDVDALVFEGHRYSFSDVAAGIDDAARRLMSLGVGHGDHVALWLNNSADWIFISFALAKVGAVQVPINTRFRGRDLDYVLRQSDSQLLITHDRSGPIDYLGMVREVVDLPAAGETVRDEKFPSLRQVVVLNESARDAPHIGTVDWDATRAQGDLVGEGDLAACAAAVDPDADAYILYTSGTTGFPKGVRHGHRVIRNIEERGFRMGITHNDVILNYLPLFHVFGLSEGALMSLISGATQVLTRTFDANESLDLIERERVSIVGAFEVHAMGLIDAQEARPRDISSLRAGIMAAGLPSTVELCHRAAKVLAPIKFLSIFGMTETWIGAACSSLDDDVRHRCESSGFPSLGYEVRIIDPDTGGDLGVGQPGEVLVRGYGVTKGYYKKLEETAASLDADGWFHTGDSAKWLKDGHLRFLGRLKDMLKVGGENVDPAEIETLLHEHPGIRQAAVVGAPNRRLLEVPVAFVQRVDAVEVNAVDVIDFCRGKVASFKLPRRIIFVDTFPMTASGKIRKVDLRAEARKLYAPKR